MDPPVAQLSYIDHSLKNVECRWKDIYKQKSNFHLQTEAEGVEIASENHPHVHCPLSICQTRCHR